MGRTTDRATAFEGSDAWAGPHACAPPGAGASFRDEVEAAPPSSRLIALGALAAGVTPLWLALAAFGVLPATSRWERPGQWVGLLLLVAVTVTALALVRVAGRMRDGRTVVLGLGVATGCGVAAAGIAAGLRLSSPPTGLGQWPPVAAWLGALAVALALWFATAPRSVSVVGTAARHPLRISLAVVAFLAAFATLSWITAAVLFPSVLTWVRAGVAALGAVALAVIGARALREYLRTGRSRHLGGALGCVLVAESWVWTCVDVRGGMAAGVFVVVLVGAAAVTLGPQVWEYLHGRGAAVAVDGIFEWAKAGEAADHLGEAADALLVAMDQESPAMRERANRVVEIAVGIARELDLPPGRQRIIGLGALFHDVGHVRIPKEILEQPGELTEAERRIVRGHAEVGYNMAVRAQILMEAAQAIRHHHEWYDGSGYPDGLAGETIPVEARVIAIADMYDALTSPRPYREALEPQDALLLMRAETGTHLDPECFRAFSRYLDSRRRVVVALRRKR